MRDIEGIEVVLEVLRPHWGEIEADFERHNNRFLELTSFDGDIIGRVLKVHLVIESFLNTFLPAHFGIDEFDALRLSFHQKARLLPVKHESAAFVRPAVLELNAVRNKLAHQPNHKIEKQELGEVLRVLSVARAGTEFNDPVDAIEAFAPVACAFLSVAPKGLQELFVTAFKSFRSKAPPPRRD